MKWIVGLGNPEARYDGTAHNLGFETAAILARRWGLEWRLQERMRAQTAEGLVAGQAAMLVKPLTYMNRSGEALGLLMRQREIEGQDLLVVTDDATLPIGRLRVRPSGRHGGHNGLRSIIERLARDDFARVRIGIWDGEKIDDLADYVLRKLPPKMREQLAEMTEVAADAAECWLKEGAAVAADRFNGIKKFQAPPAKDGPDESRPEKP